MKSVMTVGGIDPSSKKVALVESRSTNKSKAYIHSLVLPEDDVVDNALHAFNFLVEWGIGVIERDGQPPRLFIEEPVMGGAGGNMRPGPTIEQAFITGVLFAAASQIGSKITRVNNSTWKKRVLGNGNISKEKIVPLMREEHTWDYLLEKTPIINAKQHNGKIPNASPDQDIIDAGCVNLFGWNSVEVFERLHNRRKK